MQKSQRRASRKAPHHNGRRIKLAIALALTVFAAANIAYAPANLWPGKRVGQLWGSDCSQNHFSGADGVLTCTPVAANADVHEFSVSSAIDSQTVYASDTAQRDTHNNLRSRHAERPRAWNDSQSSSERPRPGHTMAERCLSGIDNKAYSCQTESHNDAFTAAESAAASIRSISGRVLNSEGIGLNGVTIVASPERLKHTPPSDSGTLRFWTVTDSVGAYSLDGLPDGEYTIRSRTHSPYRSARISARAGVDYADLVVYQNSAMVAEGQVLNAAGEPLEGVTVLPHLLGQPSVLTDHDGRFRLEVTLKPTIKLFTLRFQRPGYREQSGSIQLETLDSPDAAVVDAVMHPVESWTELNGTVYSDSGDTLAGRAIELRPQSGQRTYTAITDGAGKYTFPMVESPADYRLIVSGGVDHKDYQQPVHLTVDSDEFDVVVESYQFGEVSGQLVNANGVPVTDFDLVLRNKGSRKPNVTVSTDHLGNFEIPAAPAGELVVASQSTPSILVQGLSLRPGDKLYLPLVLDWGEHVIRGIVVDAHDNPVPASRIVLQWSHQAGGITTSATRRTAADTQGHFAFSNLGPGPHSLRIDAPGFRTVDIDYDLSRQGYDVTVRLN